MQNKIKFIAAFTALFFAVPLFAKDSKVKNPGKNEVILIGKIVVKPTEDMNFYAQTRGLKDEEKSKSASYHIPFAPEDPDDYDDDYEDFVDDNPKVIFEEGEFFYAKFKVNKKTRNLQFNGMTKYRFFGSDKTFVWVPFDFNVDVPKDVSAMYLGSFYFETEGQDFVFKNANHIDEYELAQEALDKVTKKHFDLYRADLKENPKEESKKKK
ncbi:hypothetical protein [Treponema sp.]|uniref:hypothetical protein n=1 Tax=Treponema sp. TaxID=166 RepID=UPI00388DB658